MDFHIFLPAHIKCVYYNIVYFFLFYVCASWNVSRIIKFDGMSNQIVYIISVLYFATVHNLFVLFLKITFLNIAPLLIQLYMSYIMRYKEDIVYQTFHVPLPYLIFLISSNSNVLDQNSIIVNNANRIVTWYQNL